MIFRSSEMRPTQLAAGPAQQSIRQVLTQATCQGGAMRGLQRLAGWRHTRLRVILTAGLVTLLALGGWRLAAQVEGDRGIAPIASTGDFEVSGIAVNASGDTAEEARQNGWREAQRKGWEQLYARTNGGAKPPELPDSSIASMVSAVVVEREHIGPRRYVARLGVIYDRTRAGNILGSTGQRARSAPMLVLPIVFSAGVEQLYETRTPWQRAWAQFRVSESPIDYVRPSGSGWESLLLNSGQMQRRSRSWWRIVLDEFGASNVVYPVARLERQYPGGPVSGTFTARFGPDNTYLDQFALTAQNEEALPVMLEQATLRLDAIFARALAQGRLGTDTTLDFKEEGFDANLLRTLAREMAPVRQPAAPAVQPPAPPAQQTQTPADPVAPAVSYAVQVATPDAQAIDSALAALRQVTGVQNVTVGSLAIGGTSVMRIAYAGSLAELGAALSARGWQVTQGTGALSISR
ncbi:heavy-metal-associated domain-containing protein [Croceicoccus sp. F390]|uniref:Heavy-metal-associated domain-containing protein n=1 Tax=Croceicoccus esteveae TaxID=3075597 RepID=A0ABU2ZEV1_9SPHN|nr:heavy-metal-associated domain-containing protein [Croceicoccus sp. F390]MDT0574819.1 heavy-metal-associated domain-containing protein [Croceicoccus sp. F390]